MPDLSSAAPRPYRRPLRGVGANGSVSQPVGRRGLDVVVGVEQDRRPRAGEVGEHGRRLAGHVDQLDLAAGVLEQFDDRLGRLVERLAREPGERDRRDRDEPLEVRADALGVRFDRST